MHDRLFNPVTWWTIGFGLFWILLCFISPTLRRWTDALDQSPVVRNYWKYHLRIVNGIALFAIVLFLVVWFLRLLWK